jgi:integrase
MLSGSAHVERPILAHRDAIIVSVQFGLALRNQELYGLRWSSFTDTGRARITQVLSWNELDEWAKTEHATGRTAKVPALLAEDLALWRALLRQQGHPARDEDFIVPGDLAGQRFGIRDPETGAWHMSTNQAKKWGPRFMKPALKAMAESDPSLLSAIDATPYSLRRGGISARLRGENAQSVAAQCGTSLEMLSQHYSYEIDDLDHVGPQPLDQQWRQARVGVLARQGEDEEQRTAA